MRRALLLAGVYGFWKDFTFVGASTKSRSNAASQPETFCSLCKSIRLELQERQTKSGGLTSLLHSHLADLRLPTVRKGVVSVSSRCGASVTVRAHAVFAALRARSEGLTNKQAIDPDLRMAVSQVYGPASPPAQSLGPAVAAPAAPPLRCEPMGRHCAFAFGLPVS
jgi:hypothetical protein